MRTLTLTSSILALALCASTTALADDHDHDRDQHGEQHGDQRRDPHPQRPVHAAQTRAPVHQGHFAHRSMAVIHNDPHFHVAVRGYHASHSWGRYHLSTGLWFHTWGIRSWANVGSVTCEAVNQDTGAMYPITEARDNNRWNNAQVNLVLDQALDACYSDGGADACAPVTPACTIDR
jgi:hypothetical protein